MRISFADRFINNHGVNNFLTLLRAELATRPRIKIVDFEEQSDIHLAVIHTLKRKTMNVIRIDGVYYDKGRIETGHNKKIAKAIRAADGVIFQSDWSQTLALRMLNTKVRKSTIIWNGSDGNFIRSFDKHKTGFDKLFVCCAHWRPNKRLSAIVDAFRLARKISGKNLGLRIIGHHKEKIPHTSCITSFGNVSHRRAIQLIAESDCMVHICHLDSCPNVVVESLLAGIPIVCNNIGGTPEIVKGDGVVAKIDKGFNFQPIPNMKSVDSRSVKVSSLAYAMVEAASKEWNIQRPELEIPHVADQYLSFFEKVLRR